MRGFVFWFFCVSLVVESTNLVVSGSIEASSPEERHENDSSLSSLAPLTNDIHQLSVHDIVGASGDSEEKLDPEAPKALNPLLTEGVFPYQPNPIAAVVAAGITMAVMTWKETGKVDLEGLLYILNSSDFYVGLLGSISSSYTQRKAADVLVNSLKKGVERGPQVLKTVLEKPQVKILGNIVNGFTYTMAVSSGFEYFSQIWKHCTRNIPEAQTVGGLVKAPAIRKKQVALNLLYFMVNDPNMRKRILSSTYQHRILTFEFIATNVGLYVGSILGTYLAKKYAADNIWLKRLAPIIGSTSLALLVQVMPSSWTSSLNKELVEWKLQKHRVKLNDLLKDLDVGITNRTYPIEEMPTTGYFIRGADLQSDVERILRERDLVASFQLQLMQFDPSSKEFLSEFQGTLDSVQVTLQALLASVRARQTLSVAAQIEKFLREGRPIDDVQGFSQPPSQTQVQDRYYDFLLDAAVERAQRSSLDGQGLVNFLEQNHLDPSALASEFAVFGFSQ